MARKEDATLWNARTESGNDSEFRQPTSGAHGSAGRTDRLPRGQPLAFGGTRPFCHEYKGCSFHGFFTGFYARRFPKGNEGKRVSSGYNRRRRLATRSSGKQQAERTAVRTAPIVCPEGSPLVRPQAQDFFPAGGLTRRLRRGSRACSPMGRSHFSFVGERKVCQRKPAARRLLRPAPLCVIRKYRRSGHCRARPLYLLRPASR